MRVSIGIHVRSGPWGGGNQFARTLSEYLRDKGAKVSFDLEEPDLDVVLLADPRRQSSSATYSHVDVRRYLRRTHHPTVVLHRVNECDERKGTHNVNRQLMAGNRCADYTVFISSWLRDLLFSQGWDTPEHTVVLNGADARVFNADKYERWDRAGPLKLVTHHWSGSYMKGFDVYEELDAMLGDQRFADRVQFTYIGNVPRGFRFAHGLHLQPKSGRELAEAISEHHVYLTASQNEPAGMHHIEGAMCGLPVLYRMSGALPEYCQGVGIGFDATDFRSRLCEMIDTYEHWADRMPEYEHTAERMCEGYFALLQDLIARREQILARREATSSLWTRLSTGLTRAARGRRATHNSGRAAQ